jgi:hypothetical protein
MRDAARLGWDLAELERQNRIKIIFTTRPVFRQEFWSFPFQPTLPAESRSRAECRPKECHPNRLFPLKHYRAETSCPLRPRYIRFLTPPGLLEGPAPLTEPRNRMCFRAARPGRCDANSKNA